jgi:carbamoyl-phosphate synthase small subunit
MRVGISSVVSDPDELLAQVTAAESMTGADLAPQVSTGETYVVPAVGEKRYTVAALDLGIKTATPRHLAALGVETHVLPSTATAEELLAAGPDGVFLSNGPGDPAAAGYAVEAVRGVLDARRPLFGICFGNQILGRALGLGTYKLRFGHRGLNQPVLDRVSGTVRVTSHNHGFAVDAPLDRPTGTPYGQVEVSHVGLNDDVVEGLRCLDVPAFSVQFHPESAAGPHDAAPLFQRFVDLMEEQRNAQA